MDWDFFKGSSSEGLAQKTWHFNPEEIDVLILSHALRDHTGRVPQLVKDGFRGNVVYPCNKVALCHHV
ncbi:MAG: hypothetical protein IPL23_10925 [Saprospiraceae bacterium]|nr:hypothetical protein [Saprospiraceae bacterium]